MVLVLSSMKGKVGRVRVRRNHPGDCPAGRRMTPANRTANVSRATAPAVRPRSVTGAGRFARHALTFAFASRFADQVTLPEAAMP